MGRRCICPTEVSGKETEELKPQASSLRIPELHQKRFGKLPLCGCCSGTSYGRLSRQINGRETQKQQPQTSDMARPHVICN